MVEVQEETTQDSQETPRALKPLAFVGNKIKKAVDSSVKTFNKVSNSITAASKSKDTVSTLCIR